MNMNTDTDTANTNKMKTDMDMERDVDMDNFNGQLKKNFKLQKFRKIAFLSTVAFFKNKCFSIN
jgi:hypothetical protein